MGIPNKPNGCATVWFAAAILWLFIFAHIADDVRNGHENLALGFGIPFWLIATFFSIWGVRAVWHLFPKLVPRRSSIISNWWPVVIAFVIAFIISTSWIYSSLSDSVYDSCKIICLIALTGLLLGFIYRLGGWHGTWRSVLSAMLAADIAFLAYVIIGFLNGDKNLVAVAWFFAPIGLPFAIVVSLYDSYRKVSIKHPISVQE